LSKLYIRLPSKASADRSPQWQALACPFALVSHDNAIERQGTASMSTLSSTVAKAQSVVVLLAASDVTVLRVKVPPLSTAKLKTALPNLAEPQLISDPSDCVVVAGDLSDGLRTIAVVQRTWLNTLVNPLVAFGARHITALPAQLCLPHQSENAGSVTAAIEQLDETGKNAGIDMTLRFSKKDGIGLAIALENGEPAARMAINALCAVAPEAPVTLYVPQSQVSDYQAAASDTAVLNKRITVSADNWSRWIAGANATPLDLIAGSGIGTRPKLEWRPWRWPLVLTAIVLIINSAALNIGWWQLKRETDSLRAAMIQIFKSTYPQESVIIDPLAQMQQKIAAARHDSGMASPDDFTAITAALGEAWSKVAASTGKKTVIDTLDYHDRSLIVHLKPGGESPTQQMKAALATYGLALEPVPGQSGATVWQIRSTK
jgi:general secretion pathway protein L